MTIYSTPGNQQLQANPFQGTQPGNAAVNATLQGVNPAVGLLPPNSDARSTDTVLAAVSRGALPVNALATNAGKDARGGRTVAEAMSDGNRTGYNGSAGGFDSLNSDANGGSGPGAGQANQTEGPSSGEATMIEGSQYASAVTIGSAQFGG